MLRQWDKYRKKSNRRSERMVTGYVSSFGDNPRTRAFNNLYHKSTNAINNAGPFRGGYIGNVGTPGGFGAGMAYGANNIDKIMGWGKKRPLAGSGRPNKRPRITPRGKGRSMRYTGGTYAGKIRGRVYKRTNNFIKNGAVVQAEQAFTVTTGTGSTATDNSNGTVIFGHNSIAMVRMLQVMSFALMRKIARALGQEINNIETAIGGIVGATNATNNPGVQIITTYRDTYNGELKTFTNQRGGNTNWAVLANDWVNNIIEFSTGEIMEVNNLQARLYQGTQVTLVTRTLNINAKHLKFSWHGKSILKVQNQSKSDDNSDSADLVNTNPLQGYQYFGWGQNHLYTYDSAFGAPRPDLTYDGEIGKLVLENRNQLPGDMNRFLQEPPHFKSFTHTKGQRWMRIDPGQIKSSIVTSSHTMRLNEFLKLIRTFALASGYLAQQDFVKNNTYLGRNRMFILEKIMDTAVEEPNISIGVEIQYELGCIATWYNPKFMNKFNVAKPDRVNFPEFEEA